MEDRRDVRVEAGRFELGYVAKSQLGWIQLDIPLQILEKGEGWLRIMD